MWAAAIERALDRRQTADQRIKAIDELADKLLDACYAGDLAALQELGNRLDGKPAQAIEHTGDLMHRHVTEVTDDELFNIATGRSSGTVETPGGTQIN